MKWESRLHVVEQLAAEIERSASQWEQYFAEREVQLIQSLTHIPDHLQNAVIAKINERTIEGEQLEEWLLEPFRKWAPPMADDYLLPATLIEYLLNPLRDYVIIHNCGTCGLQVPIYSTWTNDPDPPPKLAIFPECPACGGKTGYGFRAVDHETVRHREAGGQIS